MNSKLFKIAEVANIFSVTTDAIRYYEKYGLITPSYVDKSSRYRYYNIDDISTISYIISLRNAGFTMKQVKEYLNEKISIKDVIEALKKKSEEIDKMIKLNEFRLGTVNENSIEVVELEAVNCIIQKYVAKDLNEIFNLYSEFLQEIISEHVILNDKAVFIEFDSIIPKFENINISMGIEAENCQLNAQIIKRPKMKAITTFYKGDYYNIGKTYDKLIEYAKQNNLVLKGNAFEYYYESYNIHISSEDYLTKIVLPIQ